MDCLTKDLRELYERAKGYQQNQAPSPDYSTGRTDGFYEGVRYVFDKIAEQSNEPLAPEELREMAWKKTPVWCRDTDGIHAGLLCIRDDWYTSERTPHIWILDEEGNSGVYSVQSLIQAGATFYRRRTEEGIE